MINAAIAGPTIQVRRFHPTSVVPDRSSDATGPDGDAGSVLCFDPTRAVGLRFLRVMIFA
jgi:hypothetical protein